MKVTAYYDALKEVNLAVWDELVVDVIAINAALVTGGFRFSFTDKSNARTDLHGLWTALFVKSNGAWKIKMRHESFAPVEH